MPLGPDGAAELFNAGRHDLAERELRRYLAGEPQHGAAHALLALALIGQGRGMEALAALREASRLDPDHPWTVQARVEVHVRMRNRVEAEVAVGEALARFPNEPIYHARMAGALLSHPGLGNGRAAAALAAADAGLALDPNHAECMRLRAQALLMLGRKREGGEAAAEALRLAPGDAFSHVVHGRAQLAAGKHAQASASFRAALRIRPTDRETRELLRRADGSMRGAAIVSWAAENPPAWVRALAVLLAVAVAMVVIWPHAEETIPSFVFALLWLMMGESCTLATRFTRRGRMLAAELRVPGAVSVDEREMANVVVALVLLAATVMVVLGATVDPPFRTGASAIWHLPWKHKPPGVPRA
ncbi:MAG TPA: tetratricopeptide repeat protein [Longimicrobium sp.]|jgi:tetratricopeptide (TPR) repeat protein